jgi:hypothetical protein
VPDSALAGGEHLAHDHVGDLARLDAGPRQRLMDDDGAELVRRQPGEPAVERADGGAGSGDDHDVAHAGQSSLIAGHGGLYDSNALLQISSDISIDCFRS